MTKPELHILPDWPRRMNAETAAAYMSVGRSTFLRRVEDRLYPQPIREGGTVLWDRKILDLYVDAQSGADKLQGWGG